jgi:hypothetical protein
MSAGGPIIFAFAVGLIAFLAAGYGIATFLEKLAAPQYPDTQDDPRAIDILRRGQICPWPTEGECRGAGETIRRGGDRAGQRPSFTHKIQHAIARHEKRPTP